MKILLVTRYFYPRLGGGELVLWQILGGLAKKGHRIYVITSRTENTPEHEETNGIEIFRPFEGADSAIKGLVFSAKLFSYLKYFLRDNPVDILFNGAYSCTIPACRLARKTHVPSITYATYYFGRAWFRLVNPFIASLNCLFPIVTLYLANSDILCCPSEIVSKKLQRYSNSKVVVIPSPIDTTEIERTNKNTVIADIREQLGIETGQQLLIFVGRLSREKNICKLIEILGTFTINFRLVIVGEGPERLKIEKLISDLHMGDKVRLVGRKSHEDTLRIMKASDTLILPSKTEVFPTVVLEALALGKPVISTNVGGVSEIKSDNLYTINKLSELKNIISNGIQSKPEIKMIERYSLTTIVSEFEEMFERVKNNYG